MVVSCATLFTAIYIVTHRAISREWIIQPLQKSNGVVYSRRRWILSKGKVGYSGVVVYANSRAREVLSR